jgi:HD superfamily phosphodiesterase
MACGMDGDKAYVLGLLHDIGRYEGVRAMHHIVAGYTLLTEKGYTDVARICITHSFPSGDIEEYIGENDCTEEETALIIKALESEPRDDYDALIQLCDCLALAEGLCILEIRQVDVVRRYGIKENTIQKWNAHFEIKARFDKISGHSIYELFREEIIESCLR